jgi:spermidine/putrescine transport system substrate-binding protein
LSGVDDEVLPMSTFRPCLNPSRRAMLKGAGALALGLTFLPRHSLSAEEKKLNLYNWDTYIGNDTLPNFSDQTGIEVKMDLICRQ